MIFLDNLLYVHSLDAIESVISDSLPFREGGTTAVGSARKVKANLQEDSSKPEVHSVLTKIEESLLRNALH